MTAPALAVIPAAGRGVRLKAVGESRPKGFLQLGSQPIVEESVLRLIAAGIHRIVIVTGHLAHFYVELADRYAGHVVLVHNPAFVEAGSMRSLQEARPHVTADFLLLDSDLIYESRALSILVTDPARDVMLVAPPSGSGDEVYVGSDHGHLRALSKARDAAGGALGEMVGISKISLNCFDEMIRFASAPAAPAKLEYETALVAGAARVSVRCRLVDDLLWSEIDDEAQLARASARVYPAIVARDGRLERGT
jgi:2-aminoethylphosphonate-pyruvate transaminase